MPAIKEYQNTTIPSLVNKGIKSENLIEAERKTRRALKNCKKKVIKLQCRSEVCFDVGNEDTWHVPSKCYNRICPICKPARQLRLVKKYSQYVDYMRYPRFMTLTLRDPVDLTKDNKRMMDTACQELFRELRNMGYELKRYIKAMEIKKISDDEYRFHYHIVYDGSFIPQDVLSDKWKKHSKGSFVVDIRKVYNKHHAVFYICKYIAKSVDYDIPIKKYVRIRKMRFFNSYGFKGIMLKRQIWARCRYCGARMKYAGEYELDHRLGKCVFSPREKIE